MPTEQVKQALRHVNVAGVEENFAEVLAGMFGLPTAVMVRVIFAIQHVKHPITWRSHDHDWSVLIPDPEVRTAIREAANAGALRTHLRRMLLEGERPRVDIHALVPPGNPSRICDGCPQSLDCVANAISTPQACLDGLGPVEKWQRVTLVKVMPNDRVIVRAAQPDGCHELATKDVEP